MLRVARMPSPPTGARAPGLVGAVTRRADDHQGGHGGEPLRVAGPTISPAASSSSNRAAICAGTSSIFAGEDSFQRKSLPPRADMHPAIPTCSPRG